MRRVAHRTRMKGLILVYWFDVTWSIALIVLVTLVAVAITQVARFPTLNFLGKAGWVLLVLLVPVIGLAAWFVFKPSKNPSPVAAK